MKSSFTLLELLVVIVIIGIIVSTLSFNFVPNQLQLAANQVISDIRLTQSIALKDDKYQPFPNNNSAVELNRSKYWFKQWWQIRFSQNRNDKNWWYEIFTDLPYSSKRANFDRTAHLPTNSWEKSILKSPFSNRYKIGICKDDAKDFPDCNITDQKLNLTKNYGIKKIKFINLSKTDELLFDNFGNIFTKEGDLGDSGDINPLDESSRKLLTKIAKIQLCLDNPCIKNKDRCIQINISPTGAISKTLCK